MSPLFRMYAGFDDFPLTSAFPSLISVCALLLVGAAPQEKRTSSKRLPTSCSIVRSILVILGLLNVFLLFDFGGELLVLLLELEESAERDAEAGFPEPPLYSVSSCGFWDCKAQ